MRKYLIIGIAIALAMMMLVPIVLGADPGDEFNRTEANRCGGCHYPNAPMPTVVSMWYESGHASSYEYGRTDNTYCAKCHSPLQANPLATHSDHETIAPADWQGVTCSACHPNKAQRNIWKEKGIPDTRFGIYNVADGTWTPVYMDQNANDLCMNCHSGRHAKSFQGFGKVMFEQKGVRCVDCHMAGVPTVLANGSTRDIPSHTFHVMDNVANACVRCHSNHTVEWAQKQIDKGIIHGK
jgi:hypothetical protein